MLIPTLTDQRIIWRFAGVIVQAAAGDLFEQVVAVRATFIQPSERSEAKQSRRNRLLISLAPRLRP